MILRLQSHQQILHWTLLKLISQTLSHGTYTYKRDVLAYYALHLRCYIDVTTNLKSYRETVTANWTSCREKCCILSTKIENRSEGIHLVVEVNKISLKLTIRTLPKASMICPLVHKLSNTRNRCHWNASDMSKNLPTCINISEPKPNKSWHIKKVVTFVAI